MNERTTVIGVFVQLLSSKQTTFFPLSTNLFSTCQRVLTAFRAIKNVKYLGSNEDDSSIEELNKSSDLAYNWIIQSIHDKQIDLIRHIHPGNAYAVMKVLDDNYGQIKSSISNLSLLSKLSDNKKLVSETMNDYFARTERIIHDIQSLDDSTMSSTQKKFYFLRGLEHDSDWHTISCQ